MGCKKIRDLILTGYMDSCLSDSERALVETHLTQCDECRAFCFEAQHSVKMPFLAEEPVTVPETLWARVDGAIAADMQESCLPKQSWVLQVWAVIDRVRNAMCAHRVRSAAISFAACTIIVLCVAYNPFGGTLFRVQNIPLAEQIDTLLLTEEESLLGTDMGTVNFNTTVEYFFMTS